MNAPVEVDAVSEVLRAQRAILALLEKQDLPPSEIFDQLEGSFDEITLRRALLELLTRQKATWLPRRRLSRRLPAVVHA